jgi:hypothetical protein
MKMADERRRHSRDFRSSRSGYSTAGGSMNRSRRNSGWGAGRKHPGDEKPHDQELDWLRRQVRFLREERNVLREEVASFSMPPEMKYRLMVKPCGTHSMERMAEVLGVVSGKEAELSHPEARAPSPFVLLAVCDSVRPPFVLRSGWPMPSSPIGDSRRKAAVSSGIRGTRAPSGRFFTRLRNRTSSCRREP